MCFVFLKTLFETLTNCALIFRLPVALALVDTGAGCVAATRLLVVRPTEGSTGTKSKYIYEIYWELLNILPKTFDVGFTVNWNQCFYSINVTYDHFISSHQIEEWPCLVNAHLLSLHVTRRDHFTRRAMIKIILNTGLGFLKFLEWHF